MSRLDKVRSENMDEIVDISCIPYLKDKCIIILLKQISETLAMIYDDGFAGQIELEEKKPKKCGLFEEDGYQFCGFADENGNCSVTNCKYQVKNERTQ